MKWRLIICLLFVQFFGLTQEAEASVQTKIEKQSTGSSLTTTAFNHTHPADLTPATGFALVVYKVRDHRLLPGLLSKDAFASSLYVQPSDNRIDTSAAVYVDLVRLLLFPKHHFW